MGDGFASSVGTTPPGGSAASSVRLSPHQAPLDANGTAAFTDFPRAVRVALDNGALLGANAHSAMLLRQEAEQYLMSLKGHPRIWDFCISLLSKPLHEFEATETFWACSVLLELITTRGGIYDSLPDAEKSGFESVLLGWAKRTCGNLDLRRHQFVQNKFAQLLVIAFQHSGYPSRWKHFFDDVFSLLGEGQQLIDLWLRILEAIDNHIIRNVRDTSDPNVRARDTLIKDTMRATCMPQVANTWYHILSRCHQTRPDLSRQCMQVMSPYFTWIDIATVSTEQWVNMFYHFVGIPELREEAVGCLEELCEKKMADPAVKLQHLQHLRVADALPGLMGQILSQYQPQLSVGDESCDDGSGFLSRAADLCQGVGLELMDLLGSMFTTGAPQEAVEKTSQMLHTCLPMLIQLLACGHSGLSLKVCEHSIRKYAELLKRHPPPGVTRAHIPTLLNVIASRLEFFPNFDFEEGGDYENTVRELRKQLLIVFRNLASIERDLVLGFVTERVKCATAAAQASTTNWPPIESTLVILYTFGEELGTSKNNVFKQEGSPFTKIITELFQSNLPAKVTHQAVALAFLDVLERYHQYFSHFPEAQQLLLQFTLGPTGACHPHPRVRWRACSMFSALARSVKQILQNSIDPIIENAKQLLAGGLEVNGKCALYETLGILIAAPGVAEGGTAEQRLRVLSQPLLNTLKATLQTPDAVVAGNTVMFLSCLSKGFSGISAPTMGRVTSDVEQAWREVSEAIVQVCRAYHQSQNVREKVLSYTHRLIDLLGNGVMMYVEPIVECMLVSCDMADLAKLVRVPTQLLQRIKGSVVADVDKFFVPLIQRIFGVTELSWLDKGDVPSEQAREHLDLLKAYYALLVQASNAETIHIFLTDNTRPAFNVILDSIARGCMSNPSLDIAKACFQILTRMAGCWYSSLPGFSDFLAQQVLPMAVATVKQPHFSPEDARSNDVLGAIASLYLSLARVAGLDALVPALTSTWDLPQEHAAFARQVFESNDVKAVKKLLRQWVQLMKRK